MVAGLSGLVKAAHDRVTGLSSPPEANPSKPSMSNISAGLRLHGIALLTSTIRRMDYAADRGLVSPLASDAYLPT